MMVIPPSSSGVESVAVESVAVEPVAEVIAYHGWGYDRHFWKSWEPLLAGQNVALKCFDRGYFGQPHKPTFSYPQTRKIIFAHSYGLHLCPPQQLRIADAVVVFASFVNFHPSERRFQRRSQRILKQMIDQFQSDPEAVLRAFWQNCGHVPVNAAVLQSQASQQVLSHDLQDLDHSLLCAEFLAQRPNQMVVFQGNQDRIVAPARAADLVQALRQRPALIYHDGPHALPATQAQVCWEKCREYLSL